MLKSAAPSLVFIIIFFTVQSIIPYNNMMSTISLMLSLAWGAKLFGDIRKKEKPAFKEYIKTGLFIALFVIIIGLAYQLMGGWGILGTIIIILGLVAYKLLRRRKMFLEGIRNIEEQFFGASLDRKNWEEKKPQVVFTWKKKERD